MGQLTKIILRDEKILIRTPDFNRDFVKSMQAIPAGNKTWNPTHEYWTVYKPYTQQAIAAVKQYYTYYTVVDKRGEVDPSFDVRSFNLQMKEKAKAEEEEQRRQARARQAAQQQAQQQARQYQRGYRDLGVNWGQKGKSADDWRSANKAQTGYKDSVKKDTVKEEKKEEERSKTKANRLVERRSGVNFGQACEILGVERSDTYNEMKKAYWALSKIHHTDRGGEKDIMLSLNNAWDVIKAYKIGA